MNELDLLEMVQCPRCLSFEWSSEDLHRIHDNMHATECGFQERTVRELSAAIRAGDYRAAARIYTTAHCLYIIHIDQYAFSMLYPTRLSFHASLGVTTHHYVGSYNTTTKQLYVGLDSQRTDVCACGVEAPGPNPKTGIYGPDSLDKHLEEFR